MASFTFHTEKSNPYKGQEAAKRKQASLKTIRKHKSLLLGLFLGSLALNIGLIFLLLRH